MNANQLRNFFHRSREWSRTTRGIELFTMAAKDLSEVAEADSGFFVYKKRVLTDGTTPQKPYAYAPWGTFVHDEKHLQQSLHEAINSLNVLTPIMEKWILVEDIPIEALKKAWARYKLLEFGIWPLVSREHMMGAIVVAKTQTISHHLTIETGTALMDACAAQVSLALDLLLARRIAEEASERDVLTGLLNRRGFEARLQQTVLQTKPAGSYLVFGLIDMNGLKALNDSQGHPVGDQALRDIANIICRNIRADALVARFGGDEFAILMQANTPAADTVMARLQQTVHQQSNGKYSICVGGTIWGRHGETLEQCYQVADEHLYECKRKCKNRSDHFSQRTTK